MSWNLNVTIRHDAFPELMFVMETMIVETRLTKILVKAVPNLLVMKMNSGKPVIPVRCGVVWCGVWCGMVWYGMVWCGVVWYGMVWCGSVIGHES